MSKDYTYHPLVLSAIIAIMTEEFYTQAGGDWANPRFQDEVDFENPPSDVTIVCNEGHTLPEQGAVNLKIAALERLLQPRYHVQHVLPLIKEELNVDIQTLQISGSTPTVVKDVIIALRDQLNSYSGSGFNPDDPEFVAGLDALVTVGVLTTEQKDQVIPLIKAGITPIH